MIVGATCDFIHVSYNSSNQSPNNFKISNKILCKGFCVLQEDICDL